MRYCDAERALNPKHRKAMGCMTARMLTLTEMYKEMSVDWIDYLKIDWYANHPPPTPRMDEISQHKPALAHLQHHAWLIAWKLTRLPLCVCVCCPLVPCSEGCEFYALPRFLNESMATWGHVPVTQLQIEVHVSPRASIWEKSRLLVHSYGEHGLRQEKAANLGIRSMPQKRGRLSALELMESAAEKKAANTLEWNNPQSVKEDRRARALLELLLQYGFLPFHVHLGRMDSNLCCGTEYSFINTLASPKRLPRLAFRRASSRVRPQ